MKRRTFTILTVLWMILIFSFSAKPADESSQMSLSVGRIIANIFIPDFEEWSDTEQEEFVVRIDHPVRKCAHASEYAVLGVLLVGTIGNYGIKGRRLMGYTLVIGIAYAASDEFHQLFVPGRSCQITDVMIDSAGLAAGMIFLWLLTKLYCRYGHQKMQKNPQKTRKNP